MKVKSLNDLLVHELKDIQSAEKQILRALPKMIAAASNEDLKEALQNHLTETEEQVERLEKVFGELEITGRGTKCKAMEGLLEEGKTAVEDAVDPEVRDAAIICAAQRVEHYEIAAYGCARAFAAQLGYSKAVRLLQTTLDEEKSADELLTRIALSGVNAEAEAGTR